MRPHAILVNVGRGALVDESALIQALADRRIGGAVLDVFATEPLPPESPLWDLPNVLISAHDSVDLNAFAARVTRYFCGQLRRYLDGEPLLNVVDPGRGY